MNKKNHSRFKWLIIPFVVSFAFSTVAFPSVSANTMWSMTYGGAGDDTGRGDTVQTSDGGFAIFGDTNSFGAGGVDYWLVKTGANGIMQWSKTYGGALDEDGGDMCQTSDGGFALAGGTYSFGAGDQDYYLVKTDANGNMEWNMTYGGTGDEYPTGVVQTSDGGYAMNGVTDSFGAGGEDFWLVKTDANGAMEWNMTYGGTGNDEGISLVQTSDGGYAISGFTNSFGAGMADFWLVKTDAAGAMVWNMTYGLASNENGYTVVQTSDGGYAMAGWTMSFGGIRAYLVKADAGGTMQWNQSYRPGTIGVQGIQTADGGYALIGWNFGAANQDFYFVKTDANGDMQWEMDYGGADDEMGFAVLQTSDGGYALTGNTYSFGAGGTDFWLVKTDGSGAVADYSWEWPMFRHNLAHSGYSSSPAPVTNQTLWNSTTLIMGGQSSAVVADGKLYVGSWMGTLYCFDATNGTQLWLKTLSQYIAGSCAVAYGRVYGSTLDCNIYCLDAASGDILWNLKTSNITGALLGSSPAVADGKVYVGSYDNNVYCLDALTGALIWNYTTGNYTVSSPAVIDGKVYVGSYDNNVYCLDAATGALVWNYTTGDRVVSSPAVIDGKVYVGSADNNVYCLDAATGALVWNYTTGDNVISSPAVFDGKVYVGSYDNNTYCLDALTGTKIWNYTTGGDAFGSPAVADGKVYINSLDDTLYCFDATTGDFIWSFTTEGHPTFDGIYGSPAVANGIVYTYSSEGYIYAFGTEVIPEGLTIGVMLLLSTIAVAVSVRYFRKRPKWENW